MAVKIFSGRATAYLADKIASAYGEPLGEVIYQQFSDGEMSPFIATSVRGHEVFLIQSTFPPSDNLMELLLMVDACRRASAKSVNVVIPYFGYARQDRKDKPRVAIAAKLHANLISAAGASRIMTCDLHADQIQGFFDIPVDHLFAAPVLVDYFQKLDLPDLIVVSPDAGGVERARAYAKKLDTNLAIIDKRRVEANVAEIVHIVGEVEGRTALIVDDMIDTAGTLVKSAEALLNKGAKKVYACSSHPVFSGPAVQRIQESCLEEVVVTNSIPVSREAERTSKIRVLSVAELLGKAIKSIHEESSVSSLFI